MSARRRRKSLDELERDARRCEGAECEALVRRLRRDPRTGARALAERLQRHMRAARALADRADRLAEREQILRAQGYRNVAGVDEAGMGPLAGPVVAAAVILSPGPPLLGVDDSKRLRREERARLEERVRSRAVAVSVVEVAAGEVDDRNVYQAGLLAMRRAVLALDPAADVVLVDARTVPGLDLPQEAHVKGDGRHRSIAAASILAKEHRDRRMRELDRIHPGYGFARHKGYATADHLEALRRLGPSPEHRWSFAPVARCDPEEARRRLGPRAPLEVVQRSLSLD